jgi:hypothetical protein
MNEGHDYSAPKAGRSATALACRTVEVKDNLRGALPLVGLAVLPMRSAAGAAFLAALLARELIQPIVALQAVGRTFSPICYLAVSVSATSEPHTKTHKLSVYY